MDYLGNSREFWLWWKAVSVAVVFVWFAFFCLSLLQSPAVFGG
jgi:hypothetical protein